MPFEILKKQENAIFSEEKLVNENIPEKIQMIYLARDIKLGSTSMKRTGMQNIKEIQIKLLESTTTTMSKMNNTLNGTNSRLDTAKEKISKLLL